MKSEAIENRIRDEQKKHPDLDWIKIASQKIAIAIEENNMEHSTEDILKLVYKKYNSHHILKTLILFLDESEQEIFDGVGSAEKAFNLVKKWQPKKYIRIINNEIQVTDKELSQSIEITPEVKEQLKKLVE